MRPDREDRASPRDSCKKSCGCANCAAAAFFACGQERVSASVILSVSEGPRPSTGARPPTSEILACSSGYQRFALQNDRKNGVILSVSDLPTRRDGRGASPIRASFRSHSPPQLRSLPLPLAAVAYILPTRRDSRGASPVQASFRSFSPPQTRSLFPPPAAVAYILPTRRDSRGASPVQASFRSFSPPQTRSLFPPPAAVAYLPPPGHARIPCVERHSVRAAILKTPALYPR